MHESFFGNVVPELSDENISGVVAVPVIVGDRNESITRIVDECFECKSDRTDKS